MAHYGHGCKRVQLPFRMDTAWKKALPVAHTILSVDGAWMEQGRTRLTIPHSLHLWRGISSSPVIFPFLAKEETVTGMVTGLGPGPQTLHSWTRG